MTIQDDELQKEFVIESLEHLSSVETQLLELESDGDSIDLDKINNVFRAIHSIKGVAGFLSLGTLESLAHREEEVLNRLRNRELRPTHDVINTLLKATDRLRSLLDSIESSNSEDVSDHIDALERLLASSTCEVTEAVPIEAVPFEAAPFEAAPSEAINSPESPESNDSPSRDRQGMTDEKPIHDPANHKELVTGPSPAVPVKKNATGLRDFLIESFDHLEQIEAYLVALESNPGSQDVLNAIYRVFHSLKGSSDFLGFQRTAAVAHASEGIMSELRAGRLVYNTPVANCLFQVLDHLRKQISKIEQLQGEGNEDSDPILACIQDVLRTTEHGAKVPVKQDSCRTPAPQGLQASAPQASDKPTMTTEPAGGIAKSSASKASPVKPSPTTTAESSAPSASESTIRVDVSLLDKLMTRVGELVLARNQILQFAGKLADNDLIGATQRLNLITTELQEGVMKTRMQPIGNIWSKLPRLVRDLAETCGKRVRIEMQGKDTELDKTIIEAIKDPLTHLVRNTVDHGIERPEVRVESGKPEEGCLYLQAYHEGGQVNIEISDDGAGLNLAKIRAKAIEKGLITPDQASKLSDHDTAQLIFLPGFSTADKVSNVSGRGVGMDVVKTNIEKIGGTIDLQSTEGQGTSIKIKIPLTLAIIPALIITNNGNRFAIPQVNLSELVRVDTTTSETQIEWIHGTPVYRLRGQLLPLVFLHQILGKPAGGETVSESVNIVVLRVDGRQFGLVVDRINDTEEIVVKPMGKLLKHIPVFAGATIMGDGKVALILDVLGLASKSTIVSKDSNRTGYHSSSNAANTKLTPTRQMVLCSSEDRRLALPISQVARLEKIPVKEIEHTDNREVVQYRNSILPLIRLCESLGIRDTTPSSDGLMDVIIYEENARTYGLVVNRIVDIVDATIEELQPCNHKALLGSTVIHGHVTEIVNLPAIIQREFLGIMPSASEDEQRSCGV
ncbi:MAG: chemotaxis protein CheW [Pirellula sp.]